MDKRKNNRDLKNHFVGMIESEQVEDGENAGYQNKSI